ncbi:MAG: glutamate-1-semialdehyde 2,1-aminomutase [Bacillota bacterium]
MTSEKNNFNEAKKFIPGGVNSPVRAYSGLNIDPKFIEKAEDVYIYDSEGNKYIDYVLSWGPMILGHAHPEVIKNLEKAVYKGTSYGAPTELETELAGIIVEAYSGIDKVRMVNSGTEATMSAIRLARGFTGKDKIIKMVGCYHGHSDSFLVEAGSGLATLGNPSSPGVPKSFTEKTITVPYNDIQSVKKAFEKYSEDIAAVILEPIAGNMGVIPPQSGYLEGLREITEEYNSLLIFDEVITGFRVGYGGVQEKYEVKPDLTCLGKIIGGGLPVGAFGGKKEIMDYIAPEGPVYQAGTLSGNPLAVTAGISTLKVLKNENVYQKLEEKTNYLVSGMKDIAESSKISVSYNKVTGMFTQFFTNSEVTNYSEADAADKEKFNKYFKFMLENGVYLAPSPFESTFLSIAHTKEDLDKTLNIYEDVIKSL